VKRLSIPSLTQRSLQKGEAGIVQRSFSSGKRNFSRLFRDEPLDLTVTLNAHNAHPPQVVLHTDFAPDQPGQWRDVPFRTDDARIFRLTLPITRCGLYRFRVKYSLDGGDEWFWDRAPHSYVMVDPPSMRTVRLYTLIPSASGTIRDWTAKLDGIAGMGFDALHLLPVTPVGFSNSPYSASHLFDVDPRFRDPADPRPTLDQFESFVEACHGRGIRLCLDLVFNHIGVDSDLVRACPDWVVPDETEPDGFKRAGCWHEQSWIRWEDLVPLNYDHPNTFIRQDIREYMKQYALFWSNYAAYTGGMVRFDNLHSSNNDFVADLGIALRAEFPDLGIFGEYFTDELTLERTVPEWGVNLLLANSWEYPFGPQLRHYINYLHTVSGRLRHLCAVTTHDTGVPAQLFGSDRSAMPRYAICALFTMGQTGSVQGVESGVQERIPFIGETRHLALPPIPEFRDFISRINALLGGHPTFSTGGNLTFVDKGHDAILGAYRWDPLGRAASFLLFANLDTFNPQIVDVDLSGCRLAYPRTLKDTLSGEILMVETPSFALTVPSCGVRVFEVT